MAVTLPNTIPDSHYIQPAERFLGAYPTFRKVNKTIMRLKIKGGVEVLNKADRVRYGCSLLHYSVEQGCY